jgi:hypothetical protein
MIDARLASPTKFMPECAPKQYTTNVSCHVYVDDCENISTKEIQQISDCVVAKGQSSANIICELNSECPVARLIEYTVTRNECSKARRWEVDVRWTFECTKSK